MAVPLMASTTKSACPADAVAAPISSIGLIRPVVVSWCTHATASMSSCSARAARTAPGSTGLVHAFLTSWQVIPWTRAICASRSP